jgi:hypothetical protein
MEANQIWEMGIGNMWCEIFTGFIAGFWRCVPEK